MRRALFFSVCLVVFACSEKGSLVAPEAELVATVVTLAAIGGEEADQLLFGPRIFTRMDEKPVHLRNLVPPGEFVPPFRLVVENDASVGPKVTSAQVILDGVTVFGTSDFGEDKLDLLSAEVVLTEESVLEIELRGDTPSAFRVWIESSGEVLAGPGGGELELSGGAVELDLPAGAVTEEVVLTAEPVEEPDEGGVGVPGTVFDLGPDGFVFEELIKLTFTYDSVVLIAANPEAREEDLRLFTLVDGVWVLTENSTVDPITKEVSGETMHFSQFGILTLTDVCSDGGFTTVQAAYDATIPGGTIELCSEDHSVEGVTLDAPVTIRPASGATPILTTSVGASTFFVDGYASGTVLIDGFTFEFTTPTPALHLSKLINAYAIRAGGTFDQLIVRNSMFNIDPLSRGSIVTSSSTVPTAAVFVDSIETNGGVFGIAANGPRTEVTGSRFFGTSFLGVGIGVGGGLVQGSIFDDCGNRCLRVNGGSDGDVISNTFSDCGTVRCVQVSNGAHAEVLLNTFAAPVLTGDGGPDLNQVVFFSISSSGLLDDNTFAGCGFFECVWATGVVTVSNNKFTHVVPTLPASEFEFAAVFSSFEGVDVTVENNTFHSCASFACYKIGDGTTITIRNDTIDMPNGHGTQQVLNAGRNSSWTGVGNMIVFEDNVMTGSGVGDASDASTYPAQVGLGVYFGQVTAERNSFVQVGTGVDVGLEGTLSGRDNTFDQMATAVGFVDAAATVNFSLNDFTGQITGIGFAGTGTNLTCNWWGDIAGPQNASGIPVEVYSQWATAPIANDAGGSCDGMPGPPPDAVRVAPGEVGSGPNIVATLHEAVALVASGGTITVAAGIHAAPGGLRIDRPMTLTADPSTLPTVDGEGACFVLEVNGVDAGLVTIRSLRLVNAFCGAIAVQGVYDQVIIEDSEFEAPGVTVPVAGVAGAGVVVQNNLFVGANAHMVAGGGSNVQVLSNRFSGPGTSIGFSGSGKIEDNTMTSCQGNCIVIGGAPGDRVEVLNNTINVDITGPIASAILVLPGIHTIVGNEIVGTGQDNMVASDHPNHFPITLAGIEVVNSAVATVSANSIQNAFIGLQFGFNVLVTGTDNVVNNVAVGIQAFHSGDVTITKSDLTDYDVSLESFAGEPKDFTCNWWGSDAGPVAPNVPNASVYTPWATVPIANKPSVVCSAP